MDQCPSKIKCILKEKYLNINCYISSVRQNYICTRQQQKRKIYVVGVGEKLQADQEL